MLTIDDVLTSDDVAASEAVDRRVPFVLASSKS